MYAQDTHSATDFILCDHHRRLREEWHLPRTGENHAPSKTTHMFGQSLTRLLDEGLGAILLCASLKPPNWIFCVIIVYAFHM